MRAALGVVGDTYPSQTEEATMGGAAIVGATNGVV